MSSAIAFETTFNFEPPVPVRDDESANPSLARLATVAWYGTDYPRGFRDQTCEESFMQTFDDLGHNPVLVAYRVAEILEGKHLITLGK